MTIKQLKEAIKDLPDEMLVMLDERHTEGDYAHCEGAKVEVLTFGNEDEEVEVDEPCLILSE